MIVPGQVAVWKRPVVSNGVIQDYKCVWAKVVRNDPGPNEVVPKFFHNERHVLTRELVSRHEWKYMLENSTTFRHNEY